MMSVISMVIKIRNDALPGDNYLVIILVMMNLSVSVKLSCCFLHCYDLSCNDLMLLMMQGLLTVGLVMCSCV
jgi:hypothetical protein